MAGAIRDLPLPHAEALARIRAEAERRGMERAAGMLDCGCENAAEVVKHPSNSAKRWELCGQPNCCAIEAAAIRAAALRAKAEEARHE